MEFGVKPLLSFGRRALLVGVVLGLVLFASDSNTRAQESSVGEKVALSISPLNFEFTINPGETREDVVKVTNPDSEKTQTITMNVEPFRGDETGQVTVLDEEEDDPAYSLKQWVTISPKTFTLKPRETRVVTFKTVVPKNAEPGGKYGAIVASTERGEIGQTGAVTVQKVGSLVLLTVQGFIQYNASARDFYTVNNTEDIRDRAPQNLYEKSPIYFLTRLHNNGTVHIKPKGFITISNIFGKKVADIEVPAKNVLPGSDRAQVVEWNDAKMGRYTATMVLNYGDKNQQITATTSFTVFPWKTGVPIIVGVLVLIWFLIARRARVARALSIIFGKH
jgi:hypothetical protein